MLRGQGQLAADRAGTAVPRADSQQWQRCDSRHPVAGQAIYFTAKSEQNSGSEIMLALANPAADTWRFQPYVVDFPAGKTSARPMELELKAIGQRVDGRITREEATSRSPDIIHPGDFDDEWVMVVRSGE